MADTNSHDRLTPLMTLEEVAEYTTLSKRWLYEQARTGRLPAILIARHYRFKASDVEDFVEGFRVSPGPSSS